MNLIKVKNQRAGGNLFHFAHFMCDCVFPEVLSEVYKSDYIFRLKSLDQTLGNFEKIYESTFNCRNIEVDQTSFDKIECEEKVIERLPSHHNIEDFKKFIDFIFSSLSIDKAPNPSCPEVLLIKRGERVELISDLELKKENKNITNGLERREIKGIDRVERRLRKKYGDKFSAATLEDMNFKDQVLHFYNAKIIVCAHGACMANLFFCQPETLVIEVNARTAKEKEKSVGSGVFPFFDTICEVLNLNQQKIGSNNGFDLLKYIHSL
jgi:hypothetical protein